MKFWRFHYSFKYSLTHPWIWLREFYWSLTYAAQRAFRGWDDTVIWDIDYYLSENMPIWLKILKETKTGVPAIFYEKWGIQTDPEGDKKAAKLFDDALDKMISGFEAAQHMDDAFGNWEEEEKLLAKFDSGFELFHKYYFCLWD